MFGQFLAVHIVTHPEQDGVHMVLRAVAVTGIVGRIDLVVRQVGRQRHRVAQVEHTVEVQSACIDRGIRNLPALLGEVAVEIVVRLFRLVRHRESSLGDDTRTKEVFQVIVGFPGGRHTLVAGTVVVNRSGHITPPRDHLSRLLVADRTVPLGDLLPFEARPPGHIAIGDTTVGTVPELILSVRAGTKLVLCLRKYRKTGCHHAGDTCSDHQPFFLSQFRRDQDRPVFTTRTVQGCRCRPFQHVDTLDILRRDIEQIRLDRNTVHHHQRRLAAKGEAGCLEHAGGIVDRQACHLPGKCVTHVDRTGLLQGFGTHLLGGVSQFLFLLLDTDGSHHHFVDQLHVVRHFHIDNLQVAYRAFHRFISYERKDQRTVLRCFDLVITIYIRYGSDN